MGDWYELSSFAKRDVERAHLLQKGIHLAPQLSQAQAQLARHYIMSQGFR